MAAATGYGHCLTCLQPVAICGRAGCGAVNRGMVRHCRRCGKSLRSGGMDVALHSKAILARTEKEPKRIELRQEFLLAPVEYGSYLWAVSLNGDVYRISPFAKQPEIVCSLGNEFGRAPFLIKEISRPGARYPVPTLIAISPVAVAAVNLVTRGPEKTAVASASDPLLCNASGSGAYVGVDCDSSNAYALRERAGRISLMRIPLHGGSTEETALADQPAAGPVVVGEKVCAFTRKLLYVVHGNDLRQKAFPNQTEPLLSATEADRIRRPPGANPWVVSGDALYIPARLRSGSGFLYMNIGAADRNVAPTVLPLPDSAAYSRDAAGRLLVSMDRQLTFWNGAGHGPVEDDPQLDSRGGEYHDPPLSAYFVRGGGGAPYLRFRAGRDQQDAALPPEAANVSICRVHKAGSAYVLALFQTEPGAEYPGLRFLIWDL